MNQSESIDLLSAALVEFQRNAPPVVKNATNPHFKNRYADLAAVIDAVRGPLAEAGLAVAQLPDGEDLITRLIHKSGQWISSRTPVKSSKPDAMGYGSGLSFARRYALSAILCLAAEDDDGVTASRPPRKPSPEPAQALRRMVAVDTGGTVKVGPYPEETTRARLAEMFGAKSVPYVLDWAMSAERKKPTKVTEFTEAHFSSLLKNKAAIEAWVAPRVEAQKNGPNAIADEDAWDNGGDL